MGKSPASARSDVRGILHRSPGAPRQAAEWLRLIRERETRMDTAPLTGIRACVFDAYGTLFDVASAAARCRDVLGERIAPVSALWREKQLTYSWLRGLQGRHADF